jgi:Xaa-Pro aminopeptidase
MGRRKVRTACSPHRYHMWCSPYLQHSTSLEDAATLFKANSALPIDSFPSHLKSLLPLSSHVYIDLPASTPRSSRSRQKSILKFLANSLPVRKEYDSIVEGLSGSKRKPLASEVARLRAFKSKCEQDVIRAAADISGTAHAKVWIILFGNSMRPLVAFYLHCRQCVSRAPASQKQ